MASRYADIRIDPQRTGIVLYVRRYRECVNFYREVLGLHVLFATDDLTCFEFGQAYLMVEYDPTKCPNRSNGPHRMCLRMNVTNVRGLTNSLSAAGIAVDYQEHDWGKVAKFTDPDGNLCAFKDEPGFASQVESGTSIRQ